MSLRERMIGKSWKRFEHSDAYCFEQLECDTTDNGRYYSNGSFRYPSVTTVLGRGQDNSWLEEWKARVGEEAAAAISKEATRRGSAVHEMAERYLGNQEHRSTEGFTIDLIESFLPIRNALNEGLELVGGIEVPLYSDSLQMAGRVDLFGVWKGKWSVIDFKTSKRIKKREDIHGYFLQESAYAQMIWERTGLPIGQLVTIMTTDETRTPLIFVEKTRDWLGQVYDIRQKVRETHGI